MQIKRYLEIFGVGMVKNGYGQSGDGTLKLTVSEEWTDRINWFLLVDKDSKKLKVDQIFFWVGMVKNGCGQSGHELWTKLIFWMMIVI